MHTDHDRIPLLAVYATRADYADARARPAIKPLRQVVTRSIIVCYREDIELLRSALEANGLGPTVLRGSYSEEELQSPANTRAFMNHRRAWELASRSDGYTLICEADFVPCKGIGELPVFWPLDCPNAWGYLYQGSPRLFALDGPEGYLRGHCAPLVAYVVNAKVAEMMLNFFKSEIETYGTRAYFTFDAHLQWWVMGRGGRAYLSARHYGEHGGLPNPEHGTFSLVTRAGAHRADVLAGPLAFLPQYARGSQLIFWKERLKARAFGWARLLSGRWIVDTNVYSRNARQTVAMYWCGLRRLMC